MESYVLIGYPSSYKGGLILPAQVFPHWSHKKLTLWPDRKSYIDKACSVKMVGYLPCVFFNFFSFRVLLILTSSWPINMQTRTWPKSGHLDLMIGQ